LFFQIAAEPGILQDYVDKETQPEAVPLRVLLLSMSTDVSEVVDVFAKEVVSLSGSSIRGVVSLFMFRVRHPLVKMSLCRVAFDFNKPQAVLASALHKLIVQTPCVTVANNAPRFLKGIPHFLEGCRM
jgi:hypothetical protein